MSALSELTYTTWLDEQAKRYVLIKTGNGRASFWRRIRREMTAAGMMELHQSAKSQIIDLAGLLRFDLGAKKLTNERNARRTTRTRNAGTARP